MRILFCIPDIDQGGSAKSLSILIERLYKKHDLAILSFRAPDPAKRIGARYGELGIPLTIFRWGWLPVSFMGCKVLTADEQRHCQAQRKFLPEIRALASSFDAICFNSYMSASLAPELPADLPKFLMAREVLDESCPEFAAASDMLRTHIARAIAIGPVEAAQLGRMGIAHETVFNTGPEKPVAAPLPDLSGLRFGVFSQITPSKGLHTLLLAAGGAAGILRRNRASIRVFGNGPRIFMDSLRRAAREHGLEDVFRLEGWTDDAPGRMKSMHCIVRPDATGSPWGRDVIEAMSMGRPVLATGSEDVFIRNGRTGVLVPPDDPVALAGALARLASAPKLLERMAQNAFAFARENFDPDTNAEKVDAALFRA